VDLLRGLRLVEAVRVDGLVFGGKMAPRAVTLGETKTLKRATLWHSIQYQIVPDVGSIHAVS
jgi:hypothetical protein